MSFPFPINTPKNNSSSLISEQNETNQEFLREFESDTVSFATSIRSAFSELQERNLHLQLSPDNVVNYFKNQKQILVKHLIQVISRVQESWKSYMITQENRIEVLEELTEIRREINCFSTDLELGFHDVDNREQLSQFKEIFQNSLQHSQARLQGICEQVGFKSIKKGLSILLGQEWRDYFKEDSLLTINMMQLLFTPTSFQILDVQETINENFVDLVTEDGRSFSQSKLAAEWGVPFFTQFRVFEPESVVDHVHGAELNIPVRLNEGLLQVLVMKGYFNNDPVLMDGQIDWVRDKRLAVEYALEIQEGIPESFRDIYLTQYPVRDLLLKPVEAIIKELSNDYSLVEGMQGKILPSFLIQFGDANLEKQVKLIALVLIQENERVMMFTYALLRKVAPNFIELLNQTLHFSLLRRLDPVRKELDQISKDLNQLKVNDVPFETQIALSNMDDEIKQKALAKLEIVNQQGLEADKAKKYLEGLLKVPFGIYTAEPVSIESDPNEIKAYLDQVADTLDKAVFGHLGAKNAVIEWVAQRIANGQSQGECIALEGPPGNGKTTFAREGIAKALGRPFAFISMSGQNDSCVLIGSQFTYIGSNWGRIVEILREAQCMDPVIYIDEVDKISHTEKGQELIGILTVLTDFPQNREFQDSYFFGVPFDLSRALFIFSYNDPRMLDPIFMDRLKIIRTNPLSLEDKIRVAQDYLMKEILHSCGFEKQAIFIDDDAVRFLIENYTFEAGVRKLKENLFAIVRAINKQRLIAPDSISFPYQINEGTIIKFRDQPTLELRKIASGPMVGMVNGLYATSVGIGGLTIVQAYRTIADERLGLTLTGCQGFVMQESMTVARSVAWNLIPQEIRNEILSGPIEGLHIHAPEGATPKDGPSVGGAITTGIISLLTGIPIRHDVAMTGEIDLTGHISIIGGLEAKLRGAKRAGVHLALCPRENWRDLESINNRFPELIDDTFDVILVDNIHDILDYALVENPIPRPISFDPYLRRLPSDRVEVLEPLEDLGTVIVCNDSLAVDNE